MNTRLHDIVFYDGGCGLCHRAVRFLLARDPDGSRFVFAPLGGATFVERLDDERRSRLPDSIVVVTADDRLLVRSRAVLRLLSRLGAGWRGLARLMRVVPTGLLDPAYDFVASIRFRLFERPADACPLLPLDLRRRFLP